MIKTVAVDTNALTDAIILAQMYRIKPDEFLTSDEDLQKIYANKFPE